MDDITDKFKFNFNTTKLILDKGDRLARMGTEIRQKIDKTCYKKFSYIIIIITLKLTIIIIIIKSFSS